MDSQNELFALCKKTGGTYMAYELRPYQKECKDILDKTPTGNHLVVMATGLGKTVVMTHLKRNGRVLLLSHRDELVRQPEKYFDCSFGIEKAEEHAGDEEVVSASVQSLSRPDRMKRFAPDAFDTIIIDEAHHSAAKSYRAVLDYFSGAKRRIGFTATPQRGDNVRLTDVFDDIIFNRDLRWGIQNNYLSRIRCEQVFGKFKLKNVKKHLGDYSDSDLEKVMLDGGAIVTAAKAYVEKCLDRHTLIYCVTKRLCYLLRETICSLIPDKKDTVCVVTGETPAEERRQILKDFADGKIRSIINCMVLTEGTDLPICDTIMNLRPTCNPTLYQQMAGRGTRLYEGKEFCLLIDIVPADSKKVQNLCTAPTLFGVNPALLDKEQKKKLNPDTDLLTLCDSLRGYFTTEAQRMEIETRRVDLFLDSCNEALAACRDKTIKDLAAYYTEKRQSAEPEYDFGNLDVEICPDDEKHYMINPSWDEVIYISKPDVLDNVNVEFHTSDSSIISGTLKMDKAVELVKAYCESLPGFYSYCWNKDSQENWSTMSATEKQIAKVKKDYLHKGIYLNTADKLNKLEASRLIDLSVRMKEAEKQKTLLTKAQSEKPSKSASEYFQLKMKEEDKIRERGKKQFPVFCDKITAKKKAEEKYRQQMRREYVPEKGERKKLTISKLIIPSPEKPASSKQLGYLSSLITKAEKYVSLPEISLQNLTTRQAAALIELIKTATDTFSCLNAGIQMEFCDLPQFICSAEKCENGRFAIEYKRKE